jgi:hypothetical protein
MYPASRLGYRSGHRGSAARVISVLAALVLLYGALVVFVDMAPGPGHYVGSGPVQSVICPELGEISHLRPVHYECRFVPDDPRIPQRVAIGLATILIASALLTAATRASGERPALA